MKATPEPTRRIPESPYAPTPAGRLAAEAVVRVLRRKLAEVAKQTAAA